MTVVEFVGEDSVMLPGGVEAVLSRPQQRVELFGGEPRYAVVDVPWLCDAASSPRLWFSETLPWVLLFEAQGIHVWRLDHRCGGGTELFRLDSRVQLDRGHECVRIFEQGGEIAFMYEQGVVVLSRQGEVRARDDSFPLGYRCVSSSPDGLVLVAEGRQQWRVSLRSEPDPG